MKKKLVKNTVAPFLYQVTAIICGFVLPRAILHKYGSEVNGLINSINQFLNLIAFLELGVGAVVQSNLYEPLSQKNSRKTSEVLSSAQRFFTQLARILMVYVVFLMLSYPYLANQQFDHLYSATLIAVMSISLFSQYYFGVVDRLLLSADQRGYISYTVQSITLVLNTVACVLMIKCGASIHWVKLVTSLIFLARPLLLRRYVNYYYAIDRKIVYQGEPIKQKWNGLAQHVAAIVLDGTDSIVLTVFATLSDVSVYSVYHLVISGVKQLFLSATNGIQALMGELWAKKQTKELERVFQWTEWVIHTGTVFFFGCTGVLILPFVSVYTLGVYDANYIQPVFAYLIVLAHAGHCMRLPYNLMILAAGHYKQTQINYVVAAWANVIVSIVLVKLYGLIGVAIGTLVAMSYQTIWMAWYNSKFLVQRSIGSFMKQIAADVMTVLVAVYVSSYIEKCELSYVSWAVMAVKVALVWGISSILVNSLFYLEKVAHLFNSMIRKQ